MVFFSIFFDLLLSFNLIAKYSTTKQEAKRDWEQRLQSGDKKKQHQPGRSGEDSQWCGRRKFQIKKSFESLFYSVISVSVCQDHSNLWGTLLIRLTSATGCVTILADMLEMLLMNLSLLARLSQTRLHMFGGWERSGPLLPTSFLKYLRCRNALLLCR